MYGVFMNSLDEKYLFIEGYAVLQPFPMYQDLAFILDYFAFSDYRSRLFEINSISPIDSLGWLL
jgi:hypothetical protein